VLFVLDRFVGPEDCTCCVSATMTSIPASRSSLMYFESRPGVGHLGIDVIDWPEVGKRPLAEFAVIGRGNTNLCRFNNHFLSVIRQTIFLGLQGSLSLAPLRFSLDIAHSRARIYASFVA
jgi:hypothetical protein